MVIPGALHTQTRTAQQTVFDSGGDYLMTVKGNPGQLLETLNTLLENARQASPLEDIENHQAFTIEINRNRVRTRNAAFILGMFHRATMSFAAVWEFQQTKHAKNQPLRSSKI